MIALIDCNNFYASCEQVFQPQLAGKPLVVLSNNDGNVIARSAEAKKMGIGMGVLTGSVRKFVRNHGLQIRSSNYALYGDMSSRVMETLEELSPTWNATASMRPLRIFPVYHAHGCWNFVSMYGTECSVTQGFRFR